MRGAYQVKFETRMCAATSRNNYAYLDMLDRAFEDARLPRPVGGTLCDIGSASFWYAATLQAFFRPECLVGVEVEGHRLSATDTPASTTRRATLAWRLPLSLLAPERLFQRIYHNLTPGGRLVMANHGCDEARRAAELCDAAGLHPLSRTLGQGVLSGHRLEPAILSCWTR